MFKSIYKCNDCDKYCHRKCYKNNINTIEYHNNVPTDEISKNPNKNINKSLDDEETDTNCGFEQPICLRTCDNNVPTDEISKNPNKNINKSLDDEETDINCGFEQPVSVNNSFQLQRRCPINPILEELYKLFPEIIHPPFNGFFFGNQNNI
ncbi:hypothetical protein QTP88_022122 [Uroleucon formosanum]